MAETKPPIRGRDNTRVAGQAGRAFDMVRRASAKRIVKPVLKAVVSKDEVLPAPAPITPLSARTKTKGLKKHYRAFRRQPGTWLQKHPFVLPVILFITVFIASLTAFVSLNGQTVGASDAKVVHVFVEGDERTVPTRAKTVSEVLKRLNIEVGTEDIVEPALPTAIDQDDFRVNVYRARPVVVSQGGKRTTIITAQQSARLIASQFGITTYQEDIVELARSDDPLRDGVLGQKLVITPATPVVINLYGNSIPVRTQKKTVGEALLEHNIKISSSDTLQPGVDSNLAPNTQVFIIRFGKKVETTEIVLDPAVKTVDDTNLVAGQSAVRSEGKPGKKLVTFEVELQNGKEVSRKPIQEVIVEPAQDKVVARGSKLLAAVSGDKISIMIAVGIPASDYGYVDYIISRESGWCATKWQGTFGTCPAYYVQQFSTSSAHGYGLCQSTPAIKMASAGADWATNPVTQLRWCTGYASKYGGWHGAYNFWVVNHWW